MACITATFTWLFKGALIFIRNLKASEKHLTEEMAQIREQLSLSILECDRLSCQLQKKVRIFDGATCKLFVNVYAYWKPKNSPVLITCPLKYVFNSAFIPVIDFFHVAKS